LLHWVVAQVAEVQAVMLVMVDQAVAVATELLPVQQHNQVSLIQVQALMQDLLGNQLLAVTEQVVAEQAKRAELVDRQLVEMV
jgi:hypothetical protein